MQVNYDSLLSENVKSIPPSGIRKFFDLMETMDGVISLGVGEPDFKTPWHIRDAGIFSLEKGFTKYTSNAGLSDLRKEICRYLERRFSLSYGDKEVIVTVGGSEAIDLAVRAMIDPGDEVIIPQSSFVCYAPIVILMGGKPVIIETKAENEFRLTAEELKNAITPRTKLLILPYPNNPTGAIMERKHLESIAEVLSETNIMIVSDEIYAELTYEGKHVSIANIEGMKDRTIVVNGFSKCYSMTGWRMGYAAGPEPVIRQMLKIHQYAIMCAPTTSQYAAIEALREGDRDIEHMQQDYNQRRRLIIDGFRKIGLDCFEALGAFYVFPSIRSTGLTSEEFCEKLLLRYKVAAIPGTAFGKSGEGHIRCCYAASVEDIIEALRRIELFVNELKQS